MEMSQGISETSSVPCTTPHADQELGLEEVPGAPGERRVLGLAGLTATCCIFMEREQMRSCLHSEKICILPILACLISLALCTAGLKWVFVDKIFEYEPPTHLDPKRIGQDPVVYMDQATEPTEEPTDVYTSVIPTLPTGKQVIQAKADPSMASYEPLHRPAYNSPTSALTLLSTVAPRLLPTSIQPNVKGTPVVNTLQTMETNIVKVPDLSSTTPPIGTGHFIGCSEKEKNYCVNGGECLMLNDVPSKIKYLCRYMSAVTTPNRLSPVDLQPPVGPSLPPSEMSPSVSSLATSMPSVAISPFMEEERPLLLVTPPQLREKWHDYSNSNQQRNSAHYNEGHEAHSPPPSPLRIVEDDEYETTQEYEAPAQQPVKKVSNSRRAKRTKINGHGQHKVESDSDSISVSNSSESETEDERIGEDTPFLSIQNPMTTNLDSAPTFWLAEGSRTNTSQKLSAQDELQARLSGVISNQDPIAV
ncbi:NRG1 protein, partial [Polypterus senegalus]